MLTEPMTSGRCLCGAVSYTISGDLRPIVYCHCEQCRRTSGHFVAATACRQSQISLDESTGMAWYRSSPDAQRGFCKTCGSSLFWVPEHGRYWSIFAGTLDRPTGLKASSHIYVHMASDYYDIDDGLPAYEEEFPSCYFPGDVE
jgi:hypothetical protein